MNDDRLDPRLSGAALAIAGTVLALFCVWLGTALHDGIGGWRLWPVGRRFLGALPWALPLAGICGVALWTLYRRMLQPQPSPLLLLFAIVRAFAHFPLFGALALLAVIWGFAATAATAGWRAAAASTAGDDGESPFVRWLGPPLWFVLLPFVALKLPNEGDMEIPASVSRRRLRRWLPAVLVLIVAFTGASDGDTGERIDPYLYAAFAAFWLADYLIVAQQVAPLLRARERSDAAGTAG